MDDIMNAELTDILKANNIEIPVSGGGGLQSIGPGMYLFTMPDAGRSRSMTQVRSRIFNKPPYGEAQSPRNCIRSIW